MHNIGKSSIIMWYIAAEVIAIMWHYKILSSVSVWKRKLWLIFYQKLLASKTMVNLLDCFVYSAYHNSFGYQCAACICHACEYQWGSLNQWCIGITSVNLSDQTLLIAKIAEKAVLMIKGDLDLTNHNQKPSFLFKLLQDWHFQIMIYVT